MAEVEQKQIKSYKPRGYAKLTPFMKESQTGGSFNVILPAGWQDAFDVNGDHDAWVKLCKEGGKKMEEPMKQWPSPDQSFGDSPPYKKIVIAPIAGVLTCECTVFEPIEDAKNKFMFIYVHGGGMGIFDGKGVFEWGPCTYALDGHIGATVHFTNSTEECYPRGLNDTISAIKYLANTYKDKVQGICVHGESGGGNLVAAAIMKMKEQEPEKDYVDCLYIECPFLYPVNCLPEETFPTPEDIKPSVVEFADENPTHASACFIQSFFKSYKGPDRDAHEFLQDKFAWPYFATESDLKNFPVTYVQSNECDQLKDIGLRFYRQLISAGVKAYHTVEAGTYHASEKRDPLYFNMQSKRRETLLSAVVAQKVKAEAPWAKEE